MKKLLSGILIGFIALSMTACGSQSTDTEKEASSGVVTEDVTDATTEIDTKDTVDTSTASSDETNIQEPEETPIPQETVVYDGGYDLLFMKGIYFPSGAMLSCFNMFNQAGLSSENGWWGDPENGIVQGNEEIFLNELRRIEGVWQQQYGFGGSQSFVHGIPYFEWYNDNDSSKPAITIKKPEGNEFYYTLIISTPLRVDAAESIGWTFDENDQAVCWEALVSLLGVFSTEPDILADTIIEDMYGEKCISNSEFTEVGDAVIKFDSDSYSFTSENCNSIYYIKAK